MTKFQFPLLRLDYKTRFILIILALGFASCATREELERRQLLHNISSELKSEQRNSSENTSRLTEIEERLNALDGKIEDTTHAKDQVRQKEIDSIRLQLSQLKEEFAELKEQQKQEIEKISLKQDEQSKYLEQVISALDKLGQAAPAKGKKKVSDQKNEPASTGSPYDSAMEQYQSGKFQEAKDQFLLLLKDKMVKGNKLAKVLHNLGVSEYQLGNYESSAVYFGKLYTDFSASSLNSTGLLFLGKALNKMGKKEEAKQALNELTEKFSKSKAAGEAKKLLQKM